MSPVISALNFIYTIVFIFVVILIVRKIRSKDYGLEQQHKYSYTYQAKEYFMTKSESEFFRILDKAVCDRYYIFPQAHLSAILDYKVPGQNWKYAFRHINGKSVDYVLCDKQTLKPIYAIELDDYTHSYPERQERDHEVERMLQSAGIPLVRFNGYKTLNQEDIAKQFFEARNSN